MKLMHGALGNPLISLGKEHFYLCQALGPDCVDAELAAYCAVMG